MAEVIIKEQAAWAAAVVEVCFTAAFAKVRVRKKGRTEMVGKRMLVAVGLIVFVGGLRSWLRFWFIGRGKVSWSIE